METCGHTIWPHWFCLFSFGTDVSYWYWRKSVSSKNHSSLLKYQTNWTQWSQTNEKVYSLHNQETSLGKGPYKVPPPWIKYLKLQLVNSTFSLHFHLTELNGKWSTPLTLTVALSWKSLDQATVVWPHTTKPSKCLLVFNSEINANYLQPRFHFKTN